MEHHSKIDQQHEFLTGTGIYLRNKEKSEKKFKNGYALRLKRDFDTEVPMKTKIFKLGTFANCDECTSSFEPTQMITIVLHLEDQNAKKSWSSWENILDWSDASLHIPLELNIIRSLMLEENHMEKQIPFTSKHETTSDTDKLKAF